MDIAEKIEHILELMNWTPYKLSQQSGVSQTVISNILNHKNDPSLSSLESIANACGITVSQLTSEKGEPVVLTEMQMDLFILSSRKGEAKMKLLLEFLKDDKED